MQGAGWHPVGLTEPDSAAAQGQPRRDRHVDTVALLRSYLMLPDSERETYGPGNPTQSKLMR